MSERRQQLLDQLGAALGGSRRRRRRLLAEINEHLRDGAAAELARGADIDAAERQALMRFGTAHEISARWNADERKRLRVLRRRYAAFALAAFAAGGLGITQYASGKNSPAPGR